MKQIVIRAYPGVTTVYDFVFGEVVDGQFTPLPIGSCSFDLDDLIVQDTLLGGQAYIKGDKIPAFLATVAPLVCSFQMFNGFIVLILRDNVTEKEKDAQ